MGCSTSCSTERMYGICIIRYAYFYHKISDFFHNKPNLNTLYLYSFHRNVFFFLYSTADSVNELIIKHVVSLLNSMKYYFINIL